ncbi:MAG: hypothetical protein Q9207_008204 [Kuettlingeria erythrocarpa]
MAIRRFSPLQDPSPSPRRFGRRSPSPPSPFTCANRANSKFLSLPAEIRLNIYSFCLISSSSIVVWSGNFETYRSDKRPSRLQMHREEMTSSTRNLALGLLRCSTTVAAESARVFYRGNLFRFTGYHEYYPVITWLDKLGKNRKYLENLAISVRRPDRAWQMPDGSRHQLAYTMSRGLSLHHPHLAPPEEPSYLEGEVDVVDPALETIISLLSKSSSDGGRKMTLYLDTGYYIIPGIELIIEEYTSLFSMDLPNLVETWRTSYFFDDDPGASSLDVVWKAEVSREDFYDKRALIQNVGWKIFEKQEAERIYNCFGRPGEDEVIPTMRFLMRRDHLLAPGAPFMAANASPFTDVYIKPEKFGNDYY